MYRCKDNDVFGAILYRTHPITEHFFELIGNPFLRSYQKNLSVKLGVCLPSTCLTEDVSFLTLKFAQMFQPSLSIKLIECVENEIDPKEMDLISLSIFGTICALLIILVLIGTVYEHFRWCSFVSTTYPPKNTLIPNTKTINNNDVMMLDCKRSSETIKDRLILAFSLQKNLRNIFKINDDNKIIINEKFSSSISNPSCCSSSSTSFSSSSSSKDSIEIFHGLKFISMIWIIMNHSISFSSQWINFNNPMDIKQITYNVFSHLLVNGTFSVDCFFFIGGYLFMHNLRRYIEESKRIDRDNSSSLSELGTTTKFDKIQSSKTNLSLFVLYLNRYLRMTPTMIFIIGFGAITLRYFGSGPEWTNSTVMFDLWCRKNWWINLLYLHNFLDTDNMCLSHSWYSAVDFQFYLIASILIILLRRRAAIGIGLSLFLILGSICITWIMTIVNNYPAVPYFNDIIPLDVINSYYQNIYIKPYCRIGPYLIGLLLAYAIIINQNSRKLTKSQLILGWSFTIVSTLGVITAMLPANNGDIPSVQLAAIYSSTSRIIWSLGLAWITFVSSKNQGGFVQRFFSLKCWIPFSRLTYCAYLVHPIIIALFYGSRQQTFDYSFYLILYFTISNICITYLASIILALFIEYPISAIGKILLQRS
ncbi:Nose resistant to fluoxetine protein 6 [Sarcoptes scabiei]|uniref:Nose resistant to fluoxetine protein 6 n=1 Tax=Sarcoptes scabiei TaxID=52283 RepID=A0A834VHF4_SARSC|nr:Nose resistant to fluoxetine protein 6 [Sarcoptes scabiei]